MSIPTLQLIPLLVVANVVQSIHLNAGIPVPSTAVRNRGIAQEGSTGKIYVCASATSFQHETGMRLRQDGAIVVTGNAPTVYIGGLGFTDNGALCAVAAGAADAFNLGVPIVTGKVRVSTL